MKITSNILIIGIVALGLGLFIGATFLGPSLQGPGETPALTGPELAQKTALDLNRILTSFPELIFPHIEHRGIFNPAAGWGLDWLRTDVPFEGSPADLALVLFPNALPPLERESEEVCIWNDTVCYFPPKNIPVCIWSEEAVQNQFCFHPAMDEDNPDHPGLAHPSLLISITNLKGPLEYPADFEEKHGVRVFSRTEEELREIWK